MVETCREQRTHKREIRNSFEKISEDYWMQHLRCFLRNHGNRFKKTIVLILYLPKIRLVVNGNAFPF